MYSGCGVFFFHCLYRLIVLYRGLGVPPPPKKKLLQKSVQNLAIMLEYRGPKWHHNSINIFIQYNMFDTKNEFENLVVNL